MTPDRVPGPMIELVGAEKVFVQRLRSGRFRRRRVQRRAVDGIDLRVERGEMVGYLGPNGAGKSTTVKLLTGILVPSGGRVRVDGLDPSVHRVQLARRVGVVFGQRSQLWFDLPLRDSFDLLGRIYDLDRHTYRRNLGELVDQLDLGGLLDVPVRQLSLGQRMRGDLAAALLHAPDLVYLDEPTIGLDVVAKARVREFLDHLNRERGVTVLLTTHDLDDIERLCRRVVVIDVGRVVFDGDLAQLVSAAGGGRTLVVTLAEPDVDLSPILNPDGAPGVLNPDRVPGNGRLEVSCADGFRHRIRFDPGQVSAARVVAAVMEAVEVLDLAVEEPSIEQVIATLYADSRA